MNVFVMRLVQHKGTIGCSSACCDGRQDAFLLLLDSKR